MSRAICSCLALSLSFSVVSVCQVADARAAKHVPGPREPLTCHDMGVYGGWNEYWLSDKCPFDFFVVQAWVDLEKRDISAHGMADESRWGQQLRRARAKGKRVIADVTPLGWKRSADPLPLFKKALASFMEGVDEDLLYCITLDEENIFWNGHEEVLRKMYEYAKEKYRVPVYQWYSPSASPPGFGWPHLPADGWLIDEYGHCGPTFEQFVRSYAVLQLPVIQIVWAAPLMNDFDWEKSGEPAFDWQLSVCRKYGVPCSFFLWEGHGNVWGWSADALPASKEVFLRCVEESRRAAVSNLKPYESLWDDYPSLQPLSLTCLVDKTVSFKEDFLAGGGHVTAGAAVSGFRDLRWNGGPLELRPRQAGVSRAVLQYPLQCDFPMSNLKVCVVGRVDPRLKGRIAVVASADGPTWTREQVLTTSGTLSLSLAGNREFDSCRSLSVRVILSGQGKKIGDTPAAVESISVSGAFDPPKEKLIHLPAAPGVPMRWDANFAGASILFTGEVENQKELETGLGFVGTHGVAGVGNTVAIRQRFVCETGVDLMKVVSRNYADEPNYASTNSLGISLDGQTLVAQQATSGKAYGVDLTLDMTGDPRFRNVKEFWVHLVMRCGCGAKTPTVNRIMGLTLEGVGVSPVKGQE